MGCIWQPFCILQENVEISCYFWIILVVNSQLALFSHVRCNPLDTHWHPQEPPKHPYITITNFNYEGSYLPAVICNIVVKADLGRSPGCSTPIPLGNKAEMPWIPLHQTWQMNILWQMDPLGKQAEMPWIWVHTTWQMNLLWLMDPPLHPNAKWQFLTVTDI